jgi:Zn-dependent peptidase ImmA (M78 family)/transcriptional regulator with XRE-family HTH domain
MCKNFLQNAIRKNICLRTMATDLIGARIKALREERKLSQDDLARIFGFKDRQTVSAIETGERRLSAEELLVAIERLGAPLDYFTNPFVLAGEGKFSWRQSNVAIQRLDAFERSAGRWIAAQKVLAPQVGRPAPYLRRALKLTSKSSFEDAMAAGERFAADFKLGPVPAERLAEAMERELGVLVLMVDAIEGVSGAACRLPDLDAVLINRHEVPGRRNFDLGHECFHILTWDAMPPEHVEESTEHSKNRVEQLANNFASAVLMPATVLDRFGPWSGDIVNRLNETADALLVTATALKWRLVALGRLTATAARQIPDAALRNNGQPPPLFSNARRDGEELPPLFSKPFMEVIALAIKEGQMSARRAADVVDMSLDELAALCATYGVEFPLDL